MIRANAGLVIAVLSVVLLAGCTGSARTGQPSLHINEDVGLYYTAANSGLGVHLDCKYLGFSATGEVTHREQITPVEAVMLGVVKDGDSVLLRTNKKVGGAWQGWVTGEPIFEFDDAGHLTGFSVD